MRKLPLLLAVLLVLPALSFPIAEATPPRALSPVFSGTLNPGTERSFEWNLNRDVSEYIFHYEVTGGTEPVDVIDVYVDDIDSFLFLMGKGWAYCECPFDAGAHTVTAVADEEATGPINFSVGLYRVPQAPVEFDGFMPANFAGLNDFGILFAGSTGYTVILEATAGSYEFFVDGESQGVVTSTRTLPLELSDFHLFEVSSLGVSEDQDIEWKVEVQGPPKLEVSIVNPCPILNPESDQAVCVTGAEATASDGGTPTISYEWTASGGEFNSTTGQWVQWTAPPGVRSFTLTVRASAPGTDYVSDSDSLSVQVVPEFPSSAAPLFLALALALAAVARRRSENPFKS